jgi:proline-specific peptidase
LTESFRRKDGRTLTFRRVGAGPTVVCHPGGPGFSSRYLSDLAGLADAFTLILLDPRGTAESESPEDPRAYATADYVSDVEDLRRHLGEEQIKVLGHSHGGVVAIAYAAAHPERVRRLVVLNSLVRLRPEAMEEIMVRHGDEPWYEDARQALQEEGDGQYASGEDLGEIAGRFWPMYFANYDEAARSYIAECIRPERANPDALRVFNEGIETWDMRPDLARIVAPTLVLTGTEDFICGPGCADDIASGIAGSSKVVIDDCGHFTFVEERERLHEEVTRFLT